MALTSRREEALTDVARIIGAEGGKAFVAPADVSRREEAERMVRRVFDEWGPVDILIANAGEYIRGNVVNLDPAVIQRSFDVNFFGSVYCIQAALPHMLYQKRGRILAVTSLDGKIGLPNDAPYVSAKFALTGFLEVMRQELRDTGITVTNVMPARVDTPMLEDLEVHWISAKISSGKVARAIVGALKRPRPVVIVPRFAALLYYINVLSPSLSDRLTRLFRLEGWEAS